MATFATNGGAGRLAAMGDAATEKHDEEDLAAGVSLYSKLQEKKYKLLVKQEDIEFAKAGLKDEIVELEAKHSQLDIVKGRVKDCIEELAKGELPEARPDDETPIEIQTEVRASRAPARSRVAPGPPSSPPPARARSRSGTRSPRSSRRRSTRSRRSRRGSRRPGRTSESARWRSRRARR